MTVQKPYNTEAGYCASLALGMVLIGALSAANYFNLTHLSTVACVGIGGGAAVLGSLITKLTVSWLNRPTPEQPAPPEQPAGKDQLNAHFTKEEIDVVSNLVWQRLPPPQKRCKKRLPPPPFLNRSVPAPRPQDPNRLTWR